MTSDDVIGQARELDPAFTSERHPRRVAINFLSRLQRRLVAEWIKLEEVASTDLFTATFPLTSFVAGIELESAPAVPLKITALQRPLDLFLKNEVLPVPMQLIRWPDRNRAVNSRSAYIKGTTLFFTGREEDYTDVDRVELTYTATPADITDATADLLLPDTAEETVVSHLGAFFARRSTKEELARARREYIVDANDSEVLWLDELKRREGVTISRTTEAW